MSRVEAWYDGVRKNVNIPLEDGPKVSLEIDTDEIDYSKVQLKVFGDNLNLLSLQAVNVQYDGATVSQLSISPASKNSEVIFDGSGSSQNYFKVLWSDGSTPIIWYQPIERP